ncbi:Uncharacterized protein HZ326_14010 [Fusarium oxysporum f. sp. albedinis]|nr:Uncharacterized protein HZ326_14010 [Fusarium oxysporum f. sp. albedinis]
MRLYRFQPYDSSFDSSRHSSSSPMTDWVSTPATSKDCTCHTTRGMVLILTLYTLPLYTQCKCPKPTPSMRWRSITCSE